MADNIAERARIARALEPWVRAKQARTFNDELRDAERKAPNSPSRGTRRKGASTKD